MLRKGLHARHVPAGVQLCARRRRLSCPSLITSSTDTVPSNSAYNFVIPCDLGSKSPDGSSGKSAPVAVVVVGGQGSGLENDGSSFIHYTTYEANGGSGATVAGAFTAGRFPLMNLTIGVGLGGGAAGPPVGGGAGAHARSSTFTTPR